jgi:hypothetical protein
MCHRENNLGTRLPCHPTSIRRRDVISIFLKTSSSVCAVVGGVLLASKLEVSGYGFVFLAMSSSQLLIVSIRERELNLIVYAGSVFLFVDCFGIYRWLIA